MINSPPHKKSRYEPTTVSSSVSNTGNTMSNMNQQRTYKFSTNNTAQVKTSFNQMNNNQAQRAPSNSGSNYGNSYGTNRMPPPPSTYNQPAAASTNHHHMSNKDVVVIDNNDEDLLDISDTELIRASQVVESQLKFTNNVHHTTSNALNIFSQFNQNANDCAVGLMGPPMSTGATIYSNSNFTNANCSNQDASQLDDLRNELKQIKGENMAKDGEVKILRDKLKRLEQETQRMRTERVDLVKKLQQQQDEAKKSLQKQIEYKELENQFKSQEIVELTMKYKVLESTVKKNPNMLTQNQTYNQSPQLSQAVGGGSNIAKPKSTPTKRTVTGQNASLSDTENDNPFLEVKRPCPSTNKQQQSPSVQLRSTTGQSTSGQVVRSHAPLTSNTNAVNQINPQKSEIKTEASSSSKMPLAMTPNLCVKCESPITGVNPLPIVALKPSKQLTTTTPAGNLKRTRVLPTRSQATHSNHQRNHDDDTKFYQVTDYFAETANYLATFNENVLKTQRSNTTPINLSLFMSRLGDLAAYTRVNLNSKLASSPLTIERIEFVTMRLSDELVKIVDYCLKATSNLNWVDSTPTDVNPVPRSSMNCKPFIDVLCAAYEINFNLFLYRFNHLLVGVALDVPLDSNKMTKINKLKESFYTVMFQLLESINFSSSSSSSSVSNRSNAAKVINKSNSSSSHSSYSTLKILNCILDSFNRLLYLPCMYDTLESRDSPMAYYYACLVDGLHSYLKKFHLIYAPAHDEPPTHDVCLHQLFYEKLKKYFGEIVYSLELNENLTHPADADGSSNSSHGGQVSSLLPSTSTTSMQPIITTIVDDMNESSIIKNFKLDDQQNNEQATDRLGTDVIEIPHSQADLTVNLDANAENSKANAGGAMSTGVSSSFYTNNPYYVDIYNLNSIKLLKVEILVKFIYYLHNHQLFNSIENKLLKKCLNQRRAQTQPACLSANASHSQKCSCYKDMLNSYLLLIDYILNEKFIFNGSKLSFDEYLLKLSTPKSTYLSRLFSDVSCTDLFTDSTFSTINKSNLTMNLTEIFNLTNKPNPATTSTAATTTSEERLKKREKYENDQASFGCFMHVLIVSCFNSVLTLLDHFDDDVKKLDQQSTDNKMDTTSSDEDLAVSELLRARTLVRLERAKFYASIKYDHRLVNFYCLYRLVESTYDNTEDEHNTNQPSDRTKYARLFAHLRSSLSSLKNSFKAYIDDYLESI